MIKYILIFGFLYAFQCKASDTLRMENFEMVLPKGWIVNEDCTENDCSIIAPRDGNTDTYLESINIMVNDIGKLNYSVEKYADFSVGYLPTVIENFELLSREKLPNNAALLIYKGKKSDYHQTWKQYYYVVSTKMYILTFAAETKKFAAYQSLLEPILESFSVKP